MERLELGADDDLAWPFAFAEMLARVRTPLRRDQSFPQAQRIVSADLVVDTLRRRVERRRRWPVHRGERGRHEGAGLGLAIDRAIAQAHGVNQEARASRRRCTQ